jgi:hypothetical protein
VVLCPRHKGLDHIRQVSVVYAEAEPARLSPLPALKSADRLAWTGTMVGVAGAALIWAGALVYRGVPGSVLGVACVFFAYAIACYGLAGARRASIVRVRRGMPRALAVWRAGMYCDLCDGVFFPPGTAFPVGTAFPASAEAVGESAGQLMTPADFQHLVWAAGGYDVRTVS